MLLLIVSVCCSYINDIILIRQPQRSLICDVEASAHSQMIRVDHVSCSSHIHHDDGIS